MESFVEIINNTNSNPSSATSPSSVSPEPKTKNATNQPTKRQVETVIFHGILRVNISPKYFWGGLCENLVFPADELPSTVVSYKTLAGLLKTHRPEIDLSQWNEDNSRHAELIMQALDGFDKVVQEILRADILDLTHYFNYNLEKWDITQLCLKYSVEPVDIFVALVGDASPFGMGMFAYPKTGTYNLAEKARDDFIKYLTTPNKYGAAETHIHYDYWNGIGVKNQFPKDIHQHPMQVNMRRYNDRNDNLGYYRIIKLFADRVSANLAQQSRVDLEETN